jgi:hypothetical protein
MRAVAAFVVLASLLPGCVAPHCDTAYDQLDWHDDGLYASVDGSEPAMRVEWDPGAGALPWNRTLTWPGERLLSVGMEAPRPRQEQVGIFAVQEPHVMSMVLERDGVLVGMVEGNVSDEVVRRVFDAAVANLTRDGFDAEAAWMKFLASRSTSSTFVAVPLDEDASEWEERQHWHHQVPLAGWLDLDALASRVDLPTPAVIGIGGAQATAGGWTFTTSLPTWTVEATNGTLRVDAADQAQLVLRPGEPTVEGLREAAGRFLAFLGLQARLGEAEATGSSC